MQSIEFWGTNDIVGYWMSFLLVPIFYYPVQAWLKPSTLWWWGICFTTVLPLLPRLYNWYFCQFLFPSVSISGWTQTLELGMMRRVFYLCATVFPPWLYNWLFAIFYCLVLTEVGGVKPSTSGWWGVCSTTVLQMLAWLYLVFLPFSISQWKQQ
jgi:hypothetical protein